MFARMVSVRLKPNMAAQFSQTIERKVLPIVRKQKGFRDEITVIASNGMEAVGISLWDSRQDAEAYNTGGYRDVTKELSELVEGSPTVQTYEVANSTAHKIGSKPAA